MNRITKEHDEISLEMARGARIIEPRRLQQDFSSKFSEIYPGRQTHEEGWRKHRLNCCENNKK